MYARSQVDQKIYEANLRKEALLEVKMEKNSFDLVKWGLYKLRCEEIEDQYAAFKKR